MMALLGAISSLWISNPMSTEMDRVVNIDAKKRNAIGSFSTMIDKSRIAVRGVLAWGTLSA